MKPNIQDCKNLAEKIIVELYEAGHGEDLKAMEELGASKIADMIYAHDLGVIGRCHFEHVEAVKRAGEC